MTWQQQIEAKEKLLEPVVKRAIAEVRDAVSARTPRIREAFSYGAIGIDPKHLVVWYIFASDADKALATQSGLANEIELLTRKALRTSGYPEAAVEQIGVSFASDEEIKRAGGFREFFG